MWKRILDLPAIMLALAGLACVLAYWSGLSGPLVLDDIPNLQKFFDSRIDQIPNASVIISDSGPLGRPVSMLSFMASYYMFGADLWYWKLTNLILHLLCGVVIFFLSRRLLLDAVPRSNISARHVALVIAALWLLHPLNASTVLYLVQRMSQLAALFMFAGLLCYVTGRARQIEGRSGQALIWASVLFALPLAALSKENGILLLLLIPLVELFVYQFRATGVTSRQLSYFLLAGIALPLTVSFAYLTLNFEQLVLAGYEGRPFSLTERLLTQARILSMHLGQIFMPLPGNMPFFYDDIDISTGILKPPQTLLSVVMIGALLVFSWLWKRKLPLVCLGIWFFFVAHLMESTVFSLELVFEHRNYLPAYGVILAVVVLLAGIISKTPIRTWLAVAGIVILSTGTAARAHTWSSETKLYNYLYQVRPDSPRINAIVAEELTRQRQYDAALDILANRHDNGARLQRMYITCLKTGQLQDIDFSNLAQTLSEPIDDYAMTGIIELANLGLDSKCRFDKEAFISFLDRIKAFRHKSGTYRNRIALYQSHYLWTLDRTEEAFAVLEDAVAHRADDPVPMYLAAEWSLEINDLESAENYYHRAAKVAAGQREFAHLDGHVLKLIRDAQ